MKRTTIHIFAALALLFALAACTQDEAGFLPEGAESTSIVFTATGLNPAATAIVGTRAPVDGNWEGVQSVAVLMDGTVKTYDVTLTTAEPTNATLTSTAPHYWTSHGDITVTAWWPYTAGETTPPAVKVKDNQSTKKDFEGSDLIVADGQTVTYGSPTLCFTHRTARVTIVLTDYTEGLASVQLTGLSTEGDNPDIITPYDKGSNTYIALVAPQSVAAGTTFITCTFTNGKTLVYKMKNATDWQAGGEYTYTVSLAAAKGYTIEDDGSYTVTSADGLMNVAELVNGGKTDINITLDKNIDLTGKDWTPIGTSAHNSYKGTFDGGGHTITGLTVTTNDENVGLFGHLNRAGTVKNVVMEGIQITSNQINGGSIGGVVGFSWGTIENCSVSGSVSGTVYVGGVVGAQWGGSITGCSSSATVKGMVDVGGVVGQVNGTTITLTACYATGNVTLEIDPEKNISGGGLVGFNGGSSLLACYATGNVTSTGSSTGKVHIGGFLGDNYTTVTAGYWKNNHEQGIGYNDKATEATKVDGTGVTWKNAVDAMNTALQNAGSEWRYELTGALPTLRKQ
ncbi:fimbrillin family protein [Phocaeicola plebeius]|uniref:fimbrillin family protein n=1 Tax=Phocaeicola plebeius TaxID=310297 RepID=UPI0026F02013|nr:fimbrillin family protein [Phocaeicola plebeius]